MRRRFRFHSGPFLPASGSPVRQSARSSYGGCVVSPGVVGPGKGKVVTERSAVLGNGRMRGPHGNSEIQTLLAREDRRTGGDSHPLSTARGTLLKGRGPPGLGP